MKKIAILGTIALVICAIAVAGCTSSTSSNQATSATTQPNAFLEQYLSAYKNGLYSDSNQTVQAWELNWINSTSARVQCTVLNKTTNAIVNADETFMVFPTTQDATNYVNAMNLTAYSLAKTVYTGGAYQIATGHAPQVYKVYQYNEGNALDISAYQLHEIQQADNIVFVATAKELS